MESGDLTICIFVLPRIPAGSEESLLFAVSTSSITQEAALQSSGTHKPMTHSEDL